VLKIAFLLLHDQRFSGWSLNEFLFSRYHFAKEYARRLTEKGHDVCLYTLHEESRRVEEYCIDGYRVKVFPTNFRFPPLVPIGNSHNFSLVKEISQNSFDIVHFHNYYYWSFIPVGLSKRAEKWKLVGQYHGEPEFQSLGKFIHAYWLRFIDKFLVSTDDEIAWLRRLGLKTEVQKFPNVGVDTKAFRKKCSYEGEPRFLYVGRMALKPRTLREKNPWLILQIAEKLKKHRDRFRICMVGDGPGLGALQSYCKKKELQDNVYFLGYVSNIDLPDIYSRSWFTFVPLYMRELDPFWDGALKESLACQTPVIGFNKFVRNFEQAYSDFGLLLPPNPNLAAEILNHWIGNMEHIIDAGTTGRRFIEKYCSWGAVVESLLASYGSLLELAARKGT
jgi:glycosyltransferase involved in cell wall biosynthesis